MKYCIKDDVVQQIKDGKEFSVVFKLESGTEDAASTQSTLESVREVLGALKTYDDELSNLLEKQLEDSKPKTVSNLKSSDPWWSTYYSNGRFDYKTFGRVTKSHDSRESYFDRKRSRGYIHLTQEEAQLHSEVLNTELFLRNFILENDAHNLSETEYKYYLEYDNESGRLEVVKVSKSRSNGNNYYMSSEQLWNKLLEEYSVRGLIDWLTYDSINDK